MINRLTRNDIQKVIITDVLGREFIEYKIGDEHFTRKNMLRSRSEKRMNVILVT